LLHEKIVASNSRHLAIIVDQTKLVDRLGTHSPVPVEVVAFGLEATRTALEVLGADTSLRVMTEGGPLVTDSGNQILDCDFGEIADPARLDERIRSVVGVVESGLFIGRAGVVDRRTADEARAGDHHLFGSEAELPQNHCRRPEGGSTDLFARRPFHHRRTSRRSFMPATLLRSQIDTLEEPGPDEDPIVVDIGHPIDRIAAEIIRQLGSSG
jgi:hypothetical protein